MKNVLLFGILLFNVLGSSLIGQEKMVSQIIDENGEPVILAHVYLKEGDHITFGTESDFDGLFKINMKPTEVLHVSYLGYKDQSFTFDEMYETDLLQLETDSYGLTEVVIVGYKKRLCTGCYTYTTEGRTLPLDFTISLKNTWQYYPNPAQDFLTLENPEQKSGVIEIVNISGSLVGQQSINQIPFTVDLNSYPSGTYLIRYREGNTMEEIGRIVKI